MATSMDIAQIVSVKLDGTNYVHCASIMHTFLKGQNLWKYVIGACPLPVLVADNSNLKAVDEWEINNSKALTLLVSSVSSSISFHIGKSDCAHDGWLFLEKRYMGTNFAQKYKLAIDLHSLRKMPNQSISDFYAQISLLWDQLAAMDHKFEYEVDTVIFQKYNKEVHLVQFFMPLRDEYDSIRSSMLHMTPLSSVESALSELLAEDTRRLTRGPFSPSLGGIDTVFATSSKKSSTSLEEKPSTTRDMSKVKCNYCKEFGHMKFTCPKLKKSPHSTSTRHTNAASASQDDSLPSLLSSSASPIPTFGDIQEMINKALIGLGQRTSSSSTLSASSGKSSWIIDSGALNHMTFDSTIFMSTSSSLSPIYTADGSTLFVSYPSFVCTSRGIHISDVFHVPALSMNQLSVASLQCVNYKLGKHTALPFHTSETRSLAPFDVIHYDIWGPAPIATMGGSSYYLSCPYTPQQNGATERKHRHIVETAPTPMLSSSVPKQFWGEVVLTFVYLINQLSSPVLQNSTPFTCLYGTSPDYSLLRVFGSTCFVLLPDRERNKLSAKSAMEASSDPLWQQAMAEELQALDKAHTWDLVSLPHGKSPISCKWVYKVKTKANGSIDRYKALPVAKGYNQEYGIGYEETFAPVLRLTSVRVLIVIASIRHWDLFQMDVKNTFLNGTLTEEVYMVPPPGSSDPSGQVCKLRRALYGLKQAPRAWFSTFCSKIVQFGYTQCTHDSALFTRQSSSGPVLLLLYVDDKMITGDDIQGISDLKRYLRSCFEMKDLGQLQYFLGLEILPFGDGYVFLSKVCDSPMELNAKFRPADGELLSDATLYKQLVEGFLYLTISRPNISYAVHVVSQFMSAPRSVHYATLLRILRYIKGSLFQGLFFGSSSHLHLSAYLDADWAGDVIDRRSTTGYCIFLGDSMISWRIKKQSIVSRSSTEALYRALADTTFELVWLCCLLHDMGVQLDTPPLHCDNRSIIQIAHNDVFHERTKHIEVDFHFI
ncbi:hypothetical protein H6P81_019703 [Aristolochia fimbriata]|uniref:Integrase catalytic domain-containing protein n=1 Tax=Aristolochia fimbriata TaxID=158543 RepID=A0AAV7DSJ5_ARIFI|nr:hypothetical protein H6P81_019703 [Aristolochia fimbriata]